MGARVRPPRSRRAPRGTGEGPRPRPRPDPVRADAHLAVHVLPGRRGDHGGRPRGGGAAIMAADLAGTPQSGVAVQLCGDAHLSNFGLFGSPERKMLFDINDFDETLPGPWEWDVKRFAASLEVMGRERGFSPADRRDVVTAGVREYRDRMRRAAGMGTLDAWYEQLDAGMLLQLMHDEVRVQRVSKEEAKATQRAVEKARMRDSARVFAKRATEIEGELRIVAD